MQLIVNGQPRKAKDQQTVRGLVEELGFANKAVAVEVNKKLVPKKQHDQTPLREGDVIELVTLVGGG